MTRMNTVCRAGLLAAAVAASGCATTPTAPSAARTYTAAEVSAMIATATARAGSEARQLADARWSVERTEAARKLTLTQQAAAKRITQDRQAYERILQSERAAVDRRLAEAAQAAREAGRQEGVQAEAGRLAREQAAVVAAARERASKAADALKQAMTQSPLLDNRRLKDDKAAELQARQILDLVMAHAQRLGYEAMLAIPHKEMKSVESFGEAKVFAAMSQEFRAKFADHFAAMTAFDGLNLLNKLFGFNAWVAHDAKRLWLGFPASPPRAGDSSMIELYFDERRFVQE